jgi:hypothetical protein
MHQGIPADTDPAVWERIIEGYRNMSDRDKLQRMAALNYATKMLTLAGIRERHPNADEREVKWRLWQAYHGDDIATWVCRGWRP